jgi:hypothetical protein
LVDWLDEKTVERAMEEENYGEAVRLLRPLADRNSRWALRCLGFIYETGVTGEPDLKAARSYYERAASHGRPDELYELGRFLRTVGDETHARAAYQAAAEQGHVRSMAKLGRMMMKGRGGPADIHAGSDWIDKAVKEHTLVNRTRLAAEEQNAHSAFAKAWVKAKIARLWFKGMREVLKGLPDKSREPTVRQRLQWVESRR